MNRFSTTVSQLYNPISSDELNKIDEKIDNELNNEEVDREKVDKLRLAKKYKAMELGSFYGRDYRAMYPW